MRVRLDREGTQVGRQTWGFPPWMARAPRRVELAIAGLSCASNSSRADWTETDIERIRRTGKGGESYRWKPDPDKSWPEHPTTVSPAFLSFRFIQF